MRVLNVEDRVIPRLVCDVIQVEFKWRAILAKQCHKSQGVGTGLGGHARGRGRWGQIPALFASLLVDLHVSDPHGLADDFVCKTTSFAVSASDQRRLFAWRREWFAPSTVIILLKPRINLSR